MAELLFWRYEAARALKSWVRDRCGHLVMTEDQIPAAERIMGIVVLRPGIQVRSLEGVEPSENVRVARRRPVPVGDPEYDWQDRLSKAAVEPEEERRR